MVHVERHFGGSGGNALRAAVLGASDGLLSNFSLVMAVAGASMSAHAILLTGAAGLLAGAMAMGLGEWISVQSSRELFQESIRREVDEIERIPEVEAQELMDLYQGRGFDEATSRAMTTQMMSDPDRALDAHLRDELRLDPATLGGSPWEAAFASFGLLAAGAIVPVAPYVFLSGTHAVVLSAALSAAGLFALGAGISRFTGKSLLWSGLRQVAFGLAAAGAVFLIGHLIGTRLPG